MIKDIYLQEGSIMRRNYPTSTSNSGFGIDEFLRVILLDYNRSWVTREEVYKWLGREV